MPPKRKYQATTDLSNDDALTGPAPGRPTRARRVNQAKAQKGGTGPRGATSHTLGASSTQATPSAPNKTTQAPKATQRSRVLEALQGTQARAGPSSSPTVPPPSKKARTAKEGPPAEKRGAIFKRACPKTILERAERVMTQRFFMVERQRVAEELKEEFSVLGSTGNVYIVTISKSPSCSCPDSQKGNHCKHIMFVYFKVLHVPISSHVWYQKGLLSSELEEIFAAAPPSPNAVAPKRVREAFSRATGISAEPASSTRREPGTDDDCPVCYDKLREGGKLVWCEECGNPTHDECFKQWAQSSAAPTCVYCRAPWVQPGGSHSDEGYLNFGREAGLSPVRDTSTYNRRAFMYRFG